VEDPLLTFDVDVPDDLDALVEARHNRR